ncbi:unnamed protein product [Oikopleura dioica]|uniref:Uncharacterized protein n=1 Tax=Oikopleura dioica TaxID=34765 RepID=E4YVZ7_OIKDI|nr:unnamed protein product [Oikopleura dioica]
MLSELPTMVAAVPSSSASKRKLEIGKLHVTQSLDYIERQAYAQEDFQEIEDFILERLDQIRSKQFGL